MSASLIPELLGRLCDDLLFALDAEGIVRAANPRAASLVGADPLGRPWAELMATRSREKGLAFLARLAELAPEVASEGWELQLHVVGAAPLLVAARGGRLADGTLLVAARNELGRLSALYYEALAINDDMTALARRLTRENNTLAVRLARLEEERSAVMKLKDTELAIARGLEARREEIGALVAGSLAGTLPMVGLSPDLEDRAARHHERMRATVGRFHQMVQVGVTADWGLVAHEYSWTSRTLTRLGITWEHQLSLIHAYFQAAASLPWSDEERTVLDQIAGRLSAIGEQAYAAEDSPA